MFTKDSRTESFLSQMGIEFRYSNNVKTDALISDWDKNNIARPVPVRDSAVVEYASLMESGSPAPASILFEDSTGIMVLDGVQRISAAILMGATKLSAYLVSSDSHDLVTAVRVLANTRLQGCAEPAEWSKRRAVEVLVVDRGLSVSEVALMGGWKAKDVERLATLIRAGNEICDVGGPELPDKLLEVVSKHLPDSDMKSAAEPIVQFLNTVKQARLSAADATQHIVDFFAPITKQSKRFPVYRQRLATFVDLPEIQTRLHGRKGGPIRKDVLFLRSLKSAETALNEMLTESGPVPYVDEFFRIINRLSEKLKDVAPNQKKTTARVPADMWSNDA